MELPGEELLSFDCASSAELTNKDGDAVSVSVSRLFLTFVQERFPSGYPLPTGRMPRQVNTVPILLGVIKLTGICLMKDLKSMMSPARSS